MKRPRCERCGTRIYQFRKPFIFRIKGIPLDYFKWKVPLLCQNCGIELSPEKVSQVYGFDDSIFLGACFGSVILTIVIFAVVFSLS